jgi:hypothetical protein
LNFEINGQEYFLAFVEDERRWFLFAPMPEGIQRIPVYVDAVSYGQGETVGRRSAAGQH